MAISVNVLFAPFLGAEFRATHIPEYNPLALWGGIKFILMQRPG